MSMSARRMQRSRVVALGPVDAFIPNVTQPSAINAGVPSSRTLRQISATGNVYIQPGNIPSYITGAGTPSDPYIMKDIDLAISGGSLKIRLGNVIIRNCKIHTSFAATSSDAVIHCYSPSIPEQPNAVRIEFCDIYCDTPSLYLDGVLGHSYTVDRCDISHVIDGCGVIVPAGRISAYVTIKNSYIHDHMYFAGKYAPSNTSYSMSSTVVVNPGGDPGGSHPDGTHNDGVQVQGGNTITISGSYFTGMLDYRANGSGVTPWVRKSTADLNSVAGNGFSPWGTYASSSAITLNNNISGSPSDDVSIHYNWIGGGRFASVIWAGSNYGTYGTFSGHSVIGNRFILSGGATVPPWSSTGAHFGYKPNSTTPMTGAMPIAYAPGYPLNVTSLMDINTISYSPSSAPNTIYGSSTLAPWRRESSAIVRSG